MEQKKIELKVIGVSPNIKLTCGYGLYLQEKQGKRRGLLLIIGGAEAQAVSYAQKGLAAPRPFTHDLFFTCFSAFGVLLKEVFIYKSVDGVYYSYLYFERDGEQHCFDARTSDAIALALRFKAPIFVDAGILAREHMELGDENPSITFPMSAFSIQVLEEFLKQAVAEEHYEAASKIRDEIALRKQGGIHPNDGFLDL